MRFDFLGSAIPPTSLQHRQQLEVQSQSFGLFLFNLVITFPKTPLYILIFEVVL
eukprot:GDKH01009869.1.p1 GENE.GDKH01009869.1~~GDKH01009869.1.p1  ORF type:complete len:54 (-),score=1.02 GDKH01009869.1:58-219(-)